MNKSKHMARQERTEK